MPSGIFRKPRTAAAVYQPRAIRRTMSERRTWSSASAQQGTRAGMVACMGRDWGKFQDIIEGLSFNWVAGSASDWSTYFPVDAGGSIDVTGLNCQIEVMLYNPISTPRAHMSMWNHYIEWSLYDAAVALPERVDLQISSWIGLGTGAPYEQTSQIGMGYEDGALVHSGTVYGARMGWAQQLENSSEEVISGMSYRLRECFMSSASFPYPNDEIPEDYSDDDPAIYVMAHAEDDGSIPQFGDVRCGTAAAWCFRIKSATGHSGSPRLSVTKFQDLIRNNADALVSGVPAVPKLADANMAVRLRDNNTQQVVNLLMGTNLTAAEIAWPEFHFEERV